VKTSDQIALVREMVAEIDAEIAVAARADRDGPYPFDGALVGRAAQRWLYEFAVPPRAALSDAPVEVQSRGKQLSGWVAGVTDGLCTVSLPESLGPRATGWVDVDTAAPLRSLRTRLTDLAPEPRAAAAPRPFRFEQAALVLGAPGGRLRDEIAQAAESTDNWSLDDRQANVLGTALRHRWAFVQPPPDGNATALLVQLLERLLDLDASVLVVSPHAAAVDWSLHALCDRLRPRGQVRSGVFQRLGPIAVRRLDERHGPLVDPDLIAADLNAELDRQSTALDEAELRLRHEEAVLRYTEAEELHDELTERLARARQRSRVARLRSADKPDELVVELHKLRPRQVAAKKRRDEIEAELAKLAEAQSRPAAPAAVPVDGSGSFGGRLRAIADARDEIVDARANIEEALRRRCRLVATTTGQAFVRRLPRQSFDVVVIVGRISRPEAFYLAGLSTRSVVAVGAPQAASVGARPATHVARPGGRAARQEHGVASRTAHFPIAAPD
jgi:exonuclease VII small subunit